MRNSLVMTVGTIHVDGSTHTFFKLGTRDSFSMSDLTDLTDSDMKNVINVLEADIPDSINVSNQSFIF